MPRATNSGAATPENGDLHRSLRLRCDSVAVLIAEELFDFVGDALAAGVVV